MNIHAKEFYPAGHVRAVDAKHKRRLGRGARWAISEVPSDKMTTAPANVKGDGDAEGEVRRADDAGPAPVIKIGHAWYRWSMTFCWESMTSVT